MPKLSRHRYRHRVTFSETDAAGVMHFASYFRLMEDAEHDLYRTIGTSAMHRTENEEIGPPRVQVECEYRAPLFFEDVVEILVRVMEIGERKIRYSFDFYRVGNAESSTDEGDAEAPEARPSLAQGSMTVVFAARNPETGFRSCPIPEPIRGALEVWG